MIILHLISATLILVAVGVICGIAGFTVMDAIDEHRADRRESSLPNLTHHDTKDTP